MQKTDLTVEEILAIKECLPDETRDKIMEELTGIINSLLEERFLDGYGIGYSDVREEQNEE